MGAGRETLRTLCPVCPVSLLITILYWLYWRCHGCYCIDTLTQLIMWGFNTFSLPLCLFVFFKVLRYHSLTHMFTTGESNITWDNANSLEKAEARTNVHRLTRQCDSWAIVSAENYQLASSFCDHSNESSPRFECRCKTEEPCRLQSRGAKQAQGLLLYQSRLGRISINL